MFSAISRASSVKTTGNNNQNTGQRQDADITASSRSHERTLSFPISNVSIRAVDLMRRRLAASFPGSGAPILDVRTRIRLTMGKDMLGKSFSARRPLFPFKVGFLPLGDRRLPTQSGGQERPLFTPIRAKNTLSWCA
jgi:hypothetical protein